jgi:hypothetical protein
MRDMFRQRDRFTNFIKEIEDFPGGWNAVFCILASWTRSTDKAYEVLLDEIAETWGIEEYAPWDVAYVRNQVQTRIDEQFTGVFGRAKMQERLRTTLKGLGFLAEERTIRFFSKASLSQEDFASLVKGTIMVRDHGDRHMKQFGKYNDFSEIGLADIETNLHQDGILTYRILWHEVGHALHHLNIRSKYKMLRTAFPDYFAEGVAQAFEFIITDLKWLEDICGLEPARAAWLRRAIVSLELQKTRENSMWAFYENEVYANPESLTLPDVWARLAKRYLYPRTTGLEAVEGGREYEKRAVYFPYSALQITLTTMIREHLLQALSQAGTMFTGRAGEMFKDIYRFGGSEHWTDIIEKVTGEPFTGESAAIGFNSMLEVKP